MADCHPLPAQVRRSRRRFGSVAGPVCPAARRKCASWGSSLARPRAQRLFTVPWRDPEHLGGVRDRVAEHVHQHQRGLLVGGQGAQRGLDVQRGVTGRRGVGHRVAQRQGRPAPARPPALAAGRAARRRIRSRQAFTTMRCSQVVTAESPRKLRRPPERRDHRVLERRRPLPRGRPGSASPPPTAGPCAAGTARRTRRRHRRYAAGATRRRAAPGRLRRRAGRAPPGRGHPARGGPSGSRPPPAVPLPSSCPRCPHWPGGT